MMYPRVEISLDKIKHNTKRLVELCGKNEIEIAGVTKVFCAIPEVAKILADNGVKMLADSRIENLKEISHIKVPKLLLRLPMISQADEVVEYADISLNSELETIRVLSEKAISKEKIHKIILMVDLGDLREGIIEEAHIYNIIEEMLKLKNIELIGIGTNLTCYGGIIPKQDNLSKLVELKNNIESKFNVILTIVSGGNSSSLYLLEQGGIPNGINHLRLGEAIVLGRETAYGDRIKDTYDNCFKLIAEIIEIKDKPSVPIGEIGMDAFGNKPTFEDRGIRRRAICAVGKQDVSINDITPDDEKIAILGGSSDHLILDITDCFYRYKIGDKVSFKLNYGGILSTTTSKYVHKKIL